jgi:glycosyltransferase involved in cell wall biosynthesis
VCSECTGVAAPFWKRDFPVPIGPDRACPYPAIAFRSHHTHEPLLNGYGWSALLFRECHLKIIIDGRNLSLYPLGKDGFRGGTETYVTRLAKGLSERHLVHVITPDLEIEEQRGPREWWWPPTNFPLAADVVVMVYSLSGVEDYAADYLVYAVNGVDPMLGPDHSWASGIDAFACFSEKHVELLRQFRNTVPAEKCHITGLGIDLDEYRPDGSPKAHGRLLYANDPARGLWHVLDIHDHLRKLVPDASLHVAYDFDRQFEHHKWAANSLAEALWDCKRRLSTTDGVVNRGALSRAELIQEQLECQVHAMPSDPPNVGSQIHGITQMECAAAGAALVLDDYEAFPEVFGEAALILPQIGTYLPRSERRYDAQDWAEAIADIIRDPARWAEMSRESRALAEKHTWENVIANWEAMLLELSGVVA